MDQSAIQPWSDTTGLIKTSNRDTPTKVLHADGAYSMLVKLPSGKYIYKNRTSLAGQYPARLCKKWCTILKGVAPKEAFKSHVQEKAKVSCSFDSDLEDKLKGAVGRATSSSSGKSTGHSKVDSSVDRQGGAVLSDEADLYPLEKSIQGWQDFVVFGQHNNDEVRRRRKRQSGRSWRL